MNNGERIIPFGRGKKPKKPTQSQAMVAIKMIAWSFAAYVLFAFFLSVNEPLPYPILVQKLLVTGLFACIILLVVAFILLFTAD